MIAAALDTEAGVLCLYGLLVLAVAALAMVSGARVAAPAAGPVGTGVSAPLVRLGAARGDEVTALALVAPPIMLMAQLGGGNGLTLVAAQLFLLGRLGGLLLAALNAPAVMAATLRLLSLATVGYLYFAPLRERIV